MKHFKTAKIVPMYPIKKGGLQKYPKNEMVLIIGRTGEADLEINKEQLSHKGLSFSASSPLQLLA